MKAKLSKRLLEQKSNLKILRERNGLIKVRDALTIERDLLKKVNSLMADFIAENCGCEMVVHITEVDKTTCYNCSFADHDDVVRCVIKHFTQQAREEGE